MQDSDQNEPSLRVLQNTLNCVDRETMARAIASYTNAHISNPYTGTKSGPILKELNEKGIVPLPFRIPDSVGKQAVDYFLNTPCHNAHVAAYGDGGTGLPIQETSGWSYGSYTLEESLKAPGLLEFALRDDILDLAGGYLGCLPSLYSINTFWTFPRQEEGLTHKYHRDEDDYRFVVIFIFWTDVMKGEGEFYFVPESHNAKSIMRMSRRQPLRFWDRKPKVNLDDFRRSRGAVHFEDTEFYRRMFSEKADLIEGQAGTIFCADTFGVHRGAPPATKPRLTSWIRYGLYENVTYQIDKLKPSPVEILGGRISFNDDTRRICRLIVS